MAKQDDLFPAVKEKRLTRKELDAKYDIKIFFTSEYDVNIEKSYTSYGYYDKILNTRNYGYYRNLKAVETAIKLIRGATHANN